MSKFFIVNLIDRIFITLTSFLFVFAWINFFFHDLWLSFIFSLLISLSFVFLLFHQLDKKKDKDISNRQLQKEKNDKFLNFKLSSKQEKFNLIKSILEKENASNFNFDTMSYLKDGKIHSIIFATHIPQISKSDVENLISQNLVVNCDEIDIFCDELSSKFDTQILSNVKINIVDKNKLFDEYFKKYSIFPKQILNEKIKKFNKKELIYMIFDSKKAKTYFFCGLILIFSSIILPYHVYYVIVGSMLMLFSLISKLLPKFQNL